MELRSDNTCLIKHIQRQQLHHSMAACPRCVVRNGDCVLGRGDLLTLRRRRDPRRLTLHSQDLKEGHTTRQAKLQYLHPHLGINGSVGLNPNPLLNISGVIGTKALAFGLDVAFDTASGDFTKYNARVSHTNQDLTASLMLSPLWGAEIATTSSNENTITIGTQHELDPLTTLKGRYNNFAIVSALIQHAWRPMSLITFSTEVDTKAIEKSPKFGLVLSPKP
ncbi:hypothetical protein ZWY2020_044314 [Hordeum vulgare]|nr:hypothetical protein ZWY2020_044314 [Hordeum vulgare]